MARTRPNLRTPTYPRRLETEWLDELPAGNACARHARRDLERINSWMFHVRIMRRLLSRAELVPRRLLDLGGGDGAFIARLAKCMAASWPGVEITLVDRKNAICERAIDTIETCGWRLEIIEADISQALAGDALGRFDVTIANLVLHHFEDAALESLFGALASRTTVFIACEPRRSSFALAASRLLWAIGCNEISRHDALVSVRAGFSGRELTQLWPRSDRWQIMEGRAGPFTHAFSVHRRWEAPCPC